MVLGSPNICMSTTGASNCFATAAKSASARSAEISLIIAAPASMASRATRDLRVSTEIGMEIRLASFSITGIIRRISSSTDTGSEKGRVDSPPISMISAPSATSFSAWATAASQVKNFPPSENESGVTLTTPIMAVFRPNSMSYLPQANRNILGESATISGSPGCSLCGGVVVFCGF